MSSSLREAILKTLAYSDVFDYPLTRQELWRYLISPKKIDKRKFFLINLSLEKKILEKKGFYFFNWQKNLNKLREKRKTIAKRKIKIAKKIAWVLKLIPWVKMVGVTGTLARENAKRDDDIDLIIITSKSRLWLTRFLVTMIIELSGRRRKPYDTQIKDKICLNMFLDEDHLLIPRKERDLFSACEVIQLRPLWSKDKIYEKFLEANRWVEKFLANATINIKYQKSNIKKIYYVDRQADQKSNVLPPFLIFIRHFLFSRLRILRPSMGEDETGKKTCLPARQRRTTPPVGNPASPAGGPAFPQAGRTSFYIFNFFFIEAILKRIQLLYMKKHWTTEIISEGRLLFHPQDARKWVLAEYQKRLKRLGIKI